MTSAIEGDRLSGGPARPVSLPTSTYRLQLVRDFGFAPARRIVRYLARLGIGACYCSPFFTARPGSPHGYDVCDHNAINPELGSEADFAAFCSTLEDHGLGHIMDVVPNHMSNDPRMNPWWRDVLENGSCSPFARYFDIDWYPVKAELHGKVLLPILGDQYGTVLEAGELRLAYDDGALELSYHELRLPINPRMAPRVYRHRLEDLRRELGDDHPHVREFLSIQTALHNMPTYLETDPERIAERHREKEVSRDRMRRLVSESDRIARHIDRAIAEFNGSPAEPGSFDLLHDLLESQPYRLAYWRTALHEINYRRFFDINDLAGLRMEDPEVFSETHRLVARLIAERRITGLRIDHPDGLFDPVGYFEAVRRMVRDARGTSGGAPWYVVAEKILSGDERLPAGWQIAGTTGYGFMNLLNGLFVRPSNARSLRRIHARLTGSDLPFEQVAYQCKKLIMETSMSSELNVLAHELNRISEGNRRSRDFTLNSLRDVLAEVVACFPVYRTYVSGRGWTSSDRDAIDTAVRAARRRNPAMESSIFDFLREVLLPRNSPAGGDGLAGLERDRRDGYPPTDPQEHARRLHFLQRFQQYTGPVQAKGIEDTAFYRYNVLLSLNEVGGSPERFGRTPAQFHDASLERLRTTPWEMLATSTHDAKLGEDVRARLNVLSEIPDEWRREVSVWMRLNASGRRRIDNGWAPDRNDEYRFYQALVGSWPSALAESDAPLTAAPDELVVRLAAYIQKATKEAKIHTSWITGNPLYDEAVDRFVRHTLTGPSAARFLGAFRPFQRRIARCGMVNSLSQVVLKTGSPGVPDFYQGAELWDLNLVDPDNRRAVDFATRIALLDDLMPLLEDDPSRPEWSGEVATRTARVEELLRAWPDGRIKLFVTAVMLRLRRRYPTLFLEGQYLPLDADLAVPADLLAFARTGSEGALVVTVPRLFTGLPGPHGPLPVATTAWKTTRIMVPDELGSRAFRNVLTGEETHPVRHRNESWIFAGDALKTCPVGVFWLV